MIDRVIKFFFVHAVIKFLIQQKAYTAVMFQVEAQEQSIAVPAERKGDTGHLTLCVACPQIWTPKISMFVIMYMDIYHKPTKWR